MPTARDTLPRYVNRLLLIVAVLILALAGCGGGSGGDGDAEPAGDGTTEAVETPEGELSVAAAKEQGGSGLTVNGAVYVRLDEWMLCNSLDESSYPPGCGPPSLRIANPDALADVTLVEGVGQAGGLRWTASPVSVTGDVANDTITVTDVPSG
jgi:hypothetical protein